MLSEGTSVLDERYALEAVVGRGGMADVYRATDTLLEREVAVKVLRTRAATDSEWAHFRDEAKILAVLDHPNLLTILDAGRYEDVPYLVMDLVDGDSLAPFCAGSPIPGPQAAHLGAELATVLGYVHARGIVHRDIKPSNILIGRDGRVRLADFGIARLHGDTSTHTAGGTTIGTAAYIAPEQVRGEPVTSASDIYSLGLVLLEALTGRRVYEGPPLEAAMARLHSAPLVPTSLPTGWPRLLTQMTDVEPSRRPDADEVARTLRGLEKEPPVPVYGRNSAEQEPASQEPASREPASRAPATSSAQPGPQAPAESSAPLVPRPGRRRARVRMWRRIGDSNP